MLALFNSINSAVCGALGINTYLQGVIIMVCINTIAVLPAPVFIQAQSAPLMKIEKQR